MEDEHLQIQRRPVLQNRMKIELRERQYSQSMMQHKPHEGKGQEEYAINVEQQLKRKLV